MTKRPTNDNRRFLLDKEHKQLKDDVARRLSALMEEFGLESVRALANDIGAERSQASNWLNRYAPPPVLFMIRLINGRPVTLDWIYRGDPKGLDPDVAARLMAREQGIKLPTINREDERLLRQEAAAAVFHEEMKKLAAEAAEKERVRTAVKVARRSSVRNRA